MFSRIIFLVCYQRRNVLQKYLFFGFLSAPENALELFSFSFSSTLLSSAELLFLVFINAAKCWRFTSFRFLDNAAKCWRITFLVSYQRCKVLQNYFSGFLSTPKSAAELFFFWFLINATKCFRINFFGFLSTMLCSAKFIIWFFINAAKAFSINLFWFFINDAKFCRIVFF